VNDVRAVESFALHDERLLPDHLLNRHELYRNAKHGLVNTVIEPLVVDRGQAVSRIEDHVNEMVATVSLCGDLTDYGLAEEAALLVKEIPRGMKTPIMAVLGNHDYESNQQDEVKKILVGAGVIVLDGDSCEVLGIGFAGAKGFAGGFGRGTLGAWGEAAVKAFVQEAIDEAPRSKRHWPACARRRRSRCCTTRPSAPRSKTSPPKSFPFSDAAG
jgi:Icc-related predicted phosphoesterase